MILDITFVTYDRESGEVHSFHKGHPHGPHDLTRFAVAEYRNVAHDVAAQAAPGEYRVDLESVAGAETIMPLARLIKVLPNG